jgi:predicted dehydrogenase
MKAIAYTFDLISLCKVQTQPKGESMPNRVKVGVVGTSWWVDGMYLPVLTADEGAELVAICGRNRTRANELATKYQIPQAFTDYQEMIERGGLEALVVATPDELHYPITMAALHVGLHVLCEKPMAINGEQAKEMLELAEQAGVKHMIMFGWRWMPHYQYLHQLLAEGFVGRCYHVHLQFLGNRGRSKEYTWRFDPQHSLGVLGDLGSHMIDLGQWLLGDITSVCAHLASYVERPGPDGQPFLGANESALLVVEYANGAQGMIHASTVAHTADRLREQYISIHGENGTLEAEVLFRGAEAGATVRGARQEETSFQVLPTPQSYAKGLAPNQFTEVLTKHPVGARLFIDAIQQNYVPSPNFQDGYQVQRVIDAALESQATRGWVDVK